MMLDWSASVHRHRSGKAARCLAPGSAILLSLIDASCSSSHPHVTPTPTHTVAAINPLTGVGAVPSGPVTAVKVDDTANGRPPRGLDQADVVYVESAEGGVSRLVAVFATHRVTVEAVRSVRASDVELLEQYGDILLVASGGGGDALPTVNKSKLHAVINDRGASGFMRDKTRSAPYNLEADLAAIAAQQTKGASAQDIGLRWSSNPPTSGPQVSSVKATVGSTAVEFRWNASAHRYERFIDGQVETTADGKKVQTPNVIVQFCKVTQDRGDLDVTGKPAAYTHTVGSGTVAVFRDGRRIDGTWSRPQSAAPTTFRDTANNPITLSPGGVWFLLVAQGTPIG